MSTLINDIRFGVRQLTKSPGFTCTVVFILALGIGTNTAIFSVIHAVLLRPLPFDEPDRLVGIWQTNLATGDMRHTVSYPNIEDWRRECQAFEGIAAFCASSKTVSWQACPMEIDSACVSANLCGLLRVKPQLGRFFTPEEEQQRLNDRVVLTHGFWVQHCQADPNIVGRPIQLDDESYTVIGVLPDIRIPSGALGQAQVWTLITEEANTFPQRGFHTFETLARLKPGLSPHAAEVQLNTIASRLAQEFEANRHMGARVSSLHADIVRNVHAVLWILFGAVGLVLLIACANAVNLMLIRANTRTQEFAIRMALGAGRARLVGQTMVESLLLTLLSSVAALLAAHGGLHVFKALVPSDVPRIQEIALNGPVITFTLVLAWVASTAVGLVPVIGQSVPRAYDALKSGSRGTAGTHQSRLRTSLVGGEIAVCMVLLVGSALLLRRFWDLTRVETGFQSDRVLTWEATVPGSTPDMQLVFNRLIERIQAIPGVRSAGATTNLPFAATVGVGIKRLAEPPSLRDQWLPTRYNAVTPGYFAAMGIALRRGRLFTDLDTVGKTGTLIINETMARMYFPGEDPLGQHIHSALRIHHDDPERYEIIGIVADTKQEGYDRNTKPEIFVPHTQQTWNFMTIVARTQGNPLALIPLVRTATVEVDAGILLDEFKTMRQWQAESVAGRRFVMMLVTCFAAMALGLATLGVYGVVAYTVTQRTHEIGIRMALGADTRSVVLMILRNGVALVVLGLGFGTAGAIFLCRYLRSMLFGITTTDPVTYGIMAVLLIAVALLASYLPARRVAKIDPMEALRYE